MFGSGGEGQHRLAATQPLGDEGAQDGPPRGTPSLAVDHPHADRALATRDAGHEGGKRGHRFVGAHPVEIDFGPDPVMPTAQAFEHAALHPRAGVGGFFTRRGVGPASGAARETLAKHAALLAFVHPRAGRGTRRTGRFRRSGERPRVADRLAEEPPVLFGHGRQGLARHLYLPVGVVVYDDAKSGPWQRFPAFRMRMLLSNDDGCHAAGLGALADGLADLGEIVVVAPDRDRSGASNSLTLDAPLRVRAHAANRYCVNGTPTDCVHLALTGLLDEEPDVVVSGINDGANLGDDVLYSGTVAAALEGRTLGYPALAVSLIDAEPRLYPTAVRVVRDLLARLAEARFPASTVLNVNVPPLPYERLRGYRATRLGSRHRASPAVSGTDPRGRPVYWVGSAGDVADAGEGTDFAAVRAGYVSVTPLAIDLTRHAVLPAVSRWLETLTPHG